ncbi:hypothetical protein [Streptomyces sp. WAC05374]|nr:hypothetical protein [Streptomyces sp. WAC05374]
MTSGTLLDDKAQDAAMAAAGQGNVPTPHPIHRAHVQAGCNL